MKSYKIYIVEDMAVTRAALSNILELNNHNVVGSAATAEKAWLEIERLNPDLILLDFNLKGTKNGLWLATKIRSDLNIPFIFITAYGSDEILDKIAAVKADSYIMKPFKKRTLLANIQLAVSNFDKKNPQIVKSQNTFCTIKTKTGIQKIKIDEILYIQSDGNYVTLFLNDQKITSRFLLNNLLSEINNDVLQKTHRRYVINLDKITKIKKNTAYINTMEIPISKTNFLRIKELFEGLKN